MEFDDLTTPCQTFLLETKLVLVHGRLRPERTNGKTKELRVEIIRECMPGKYVVFIIHDALYR